MSAMTIAATRENLSEIANRVAYGNERVVLTRHSKNLVAIIPLSDLQLLAHMENYFDLQDAKASLKVAEEKGTISLEAFKKTFKAHESKISNRNHSSRRKAVKKN